MKANLILGLLCFTSACQSQNFQITFHVMDDSGRSVTNAPVNTAYFNDHDTGEEYSTNSSIIKVLETDERGYASLRGSTEMGRVTYGVLNFPGYYVTEPTEYQFKKLVNHVWQPENPTIEIVVRPIINPVPMYFGRLRGLEIPYKDKPIGLDLVKGDWVAPYGKGETADFLVQYETAPEKIVTNWWGDVPRPRPLRDEKLTITFSNDGDGIQSVIVPRKNRSELRLPREAPLAGYSPRLAKHEYDEVTGTDRNNPIVRYHNDRQEDGNYIFRIRTKKDSQGKIVSALYGQIYDDFNRIHGGGVGTDLNFSYRINPEPNSRNLEFDSKRDIVVIKEK